MARLTAEMWEAVRADHEARGMTFGELAEKYKVNKSNISRRAKAEGWNQKATQAIIEQTIENEKKRVELRNETQQLNATTQRVAESVIIDRLAFERQSNEDLQQVRDLLMNMLIGAERISDLEKATTILTKIRDARLGKSPSTAIQVNAVPAEIKRVIVDATQD